MPSKLAMPRTVRLKQELKLEAAKIVYFKKLITWFLLKGAPIFHGYVRPPSTSVTVA